MSIKYFSDLYENIYSSKTKENFHEVISSYDNGNYRSAIVMLYSLVVCDLLFKLQELKDMYNDTIAENILLEINKSRNSNDNKEKSRWEWELINSVKNETQLLEIDTYANIQHLYDHRNLSAHPALNNDYELYLPNRETVAAHIKNMLEGVFVKPPIFIKKIIDTLVEDLSEKKEIYQDDYQMLCIYLKNKYFAKMSDKMFLSVFKAIWKFVFLLDNENCNKNRIINRRCLRYMLELKANYLLKNIKEDKWFSQIKTTNNNIFVAMISICSYETGLFDTLSEDLKFQIWKFSEDRDDHCFLLFWFAYKNFKLYFDYIMDEKYNIKYKKDISSNIYTSMKSYFLNNSNLKEFIDFNIHYFSFCCSFNSADIRFVNNIQPLLEHFTNDQAKKLIEIINLNGQIHNRGQNKIHNTIIVRSLKNVLGSSFCYSEYRNFRFELNVLTEDETIDDVNEVTIEAELPF